MIEAMVSVFTTREVNRIEQVATHPNFQSSCKRLRDNQIMDVLPMEWVERVHVQPVGFAPVTAELLQNIVQRIAAGVQPQKIILFGSWARGDRGPHSDIDILVIQESSQPRPQRYAQVRRLFWGMGLPMDILVYTPEEFARYQAVPGSFTNTISHEGKVLYARPAG